MQAIVAHRSPPLQRTAEMVVLLAGPKYRAPVAILCPEGQRSFTRTASSRRPSDAAVSRLGAGLERPACQLPDIPKRRQRMPAPLPTVLSLMLHNFANDALQFANEIAGNCATLSLASALERRLHRRDCRGQWHHGTEREPCSRSPETSRRQHRHPAARHHVGHAGRHCRGAEAAHVRHERVTSVPGQAPDDGTSARSAKTRPLNWTV